MKIAILGTRGVPNYHGGFEQFAEFFSVYLAQKNHDIYVYNSSSHPYQNNNFHGVNIIHCYDPEDKIGTAGQFIYDLNCILDARKRKFDAILQLGYTSSSIWYRFLPKKTIVITNMDGLEWKRSKYNKLVQRFLKYAENLAVKSSHFLIADSIGIKTYLKNKYNQQAKYIPYGAHLFNKPNTNVLNEYHLERHNYNMLIARLEPENNIEVILDGVALCNKKQPFLVVGKYDSNQFGRYLRKKFEKYDNIKFLGGIYDINKLNNLRYFSNLYFHGHSVGGTNPSLLEAMASNCLIVAHKNEFNKSILGQNAFYFDNKDDVSQLISTIDRSQNIHKIANCFVDIEKNYNWKFINNQYLSFIEECLKK
jgi:hypothetical protein